MAAPFVAKLFKFYAKTETTPGTLITLDAAAGAINAFEHDHEPLIEYVTREGQASADPLTGSTGPWGARKRFNTFVEGGSSVPYWASTLLPACGFLNTSGVFTRDSRSPEAASPGQKTLTMGVNVGAHLNQMVGAMGNFTWRGQAGRPCIIEWDFMGRWATPAATAVAAPTYPTTAPLRFADTDFELDTGGTAINPRVAEFALSPNNQVTLREDGAQDTDDSGIAMAHLDTMPYTLEVLMERLPVGTYSPEADMTAVTARTIDFTLGAAGNGFSFSIPVAVVSSVRQEKRNNIVYDRVVYQLCRSASAGEDSIEITSLDSA